MDNIVLPPCPFCEDMGLRVDIAGYYDPDGLYVSCVDTGCMSPEAKVLLRVWVHRPIEERQMEQINQLKEALAWYADANHYDENHAPISFTLAGAWFDNGARARKVLEELDKSE